MLGKDNLTDYEKPRKAVVSYRKAHMLREISGLFGICNTTIIAWTKKYGQTGLLTKAARGGKTHCTADKEGEGFISESIRKNNDLTLKEMGQ
jgi:transposase